MGFGNGQLLDADVVLSHPNVVARRVAVEYRNVDTQTDVFAAVVLELVEKGGVPGSFVDREVVTVAISGSERNRRIKSRFGR